MLKRQSLDKMRHSENKIDSLLNLASPYLSEASDDIPILDILIGSGSKPGWWKASVAIYLDDDTLKASSEHHSPNAALSRTLEYLAQSVMLHVQSKKHYQRLVRKTMQKSKPKAMIAVQH